MRVLRVMGSPWVGGAGWSGGDSSAARRHGRRALGHPGGDQPAARSIRAQPRGPATRRLRRRGRLRARPAEPRELLLADVAAEDQRHRERERRREVSRRRLRRWRPSSAAPAAREAARRWRDEDVAPSSTCEWSVHARPVAVRRAGALCTAVATRSASSSANARSPAPKLRWLSEFTSVNTPIVRSSTCSGTSIPDRMPSSLSSRFSSGMYSRTLAKGVSRPWAQSSVARCSIWRISRVCSAVRPNSPSKDCCLNRYGSSCLVAAVDATGDVTDSVPARVGMN